MRRFASRAVASGLLLSQKGETLAATDKPIDTNSAIGLDHFLLWPLTEGLTFTHRIRQVAS